VIEVSYAGTDKLILSAIEAAVERVGPAVATALDAKDAEMVGWIQGEELHGQILNQRTGKLAGSIRFIPARQEGTSIIAQVEGAGGTAFYGNIFETGGSGPFDIYPVNKQALWWEGAPHPVRHVRHPGIPSKPFMAPALQHFTPELVAAVETAIAEALGG